MSEAAARFYKAAQAAPAEGGFAVLLDGRALRTPAKTRFLAPTRALAEACAGEWEAQGAFIDPQTMPLTRLANVAIDRAPAARIDLVAQILNYAATDLVAHRATTPAKLVARQAETWDPLVAWARETQGLDLPLVTGLHAATFPDGAFVQAERRLAALDGFRLTAVSHAAGIAGSAVIALALLDGRLEARAAFEAAQLDDLFGLEVWGEDELARERLRNIEAEFRVLERFIAALG